MSYTLAEFSMIISFLAGLVTDVFGALNSVIVISSPVQISLLSIMVSILAVWILVEIFFRLNGMNLIFDKFPEGDQRDDEILSHQGVVATRDDRIEYRQYMERFNRYKARQGHRGSRELADVKFRDSTARGGKGRYVSKNGMSRRKK
jgi:ABC-type siderophore export system fused ATPase/permease subunit